VVSDLGFPDLRAFLDQLRKDGELRVVDAEVDARLEAAEIHRRVIAAGGPALLFSRVRGRAAARHQPVRHRAARGAGVRPRPRRLIRRVVELAETLLPPTPASSGARATRSATAADRLRARRAGPVTEVVTKDVALDRLPVLTCWPRTAGRSHAAARLHRASRTRRGSNLGIYRMQVHDARSTGMHWQIGKGGGFHYAAAEARGESAAGHRLPRRTAGADARGDRAAARERARADAGVAHRGRSSPLPGPGPHPLVADAEIALVGRVPPRLRQPEGPFGDHYGYYSLRTTTRCSRSSALPPQGRDLPATVVGKPRQEDFFIGDLLQELLSPLFPLVMPGVRELWSYGETGYHSLAAAVVRERYKRESMASAFRILGEGQLSLTKFLLLTDRPVELRDFRATLEHVLARTRPETDLYVFSNLSMDTLDNTGPTVNEGSKGVWLGSATRCASCRASSGRRWRRLRR
jgi:3-polyprenyl-4-hydroxybenzoate decarboxylase